MSCNCQGIVRDWEETQGGKYPPSNHHPACDDYETECFPVVNDGHGECVIEISQLSEWVKACVDEGGVPSVDFILITRDQFEKMPEYVG